MACPQKKQCIWVLSGAHCGCNEMVGIGYYSSMSVTMGMILIVGMAGISGGRATRAEVAAYGRNPRMFADSQPGALLQRFAPGLYFDFEWPI